MDSDVLYLDRPDRRLVCIGRVGGEQGDGRFAATQNDAHSTRFTGRLKNEFGFHVIAELQLDLYFLFM